MSAKAPLPYRILLLLLPPRFRRDFGADLEAVMVERLRDARGATARAWIWSIAVVDVFMSAPAEWAHALRQQRTGDAPRSNGMDHLKLDLRFALRSLARRPGFAAIAVTTLALGIGANTAIFSVVNGVLLRPLPYHDPDRLVMVWSYASDDPSGDNALSQPDTEDVRALDAVSVVAGFGTRPATVALSGEPELVNRATVTDGLLAVFGLRPVLGRDLTHEDAIEGAGRVVVVSHAFWQTRLGGRRDVIGTSIDVNEQSYEIVGVAPASFRFPVGGPFGTEGVQLWRADRRLGSRDYLPYDGTIARLAPGVPLERASAELTALASALSDRYPRLAHQEHLLFEPLEDAIVGDVRQPLWIVLGAVGVVLLIACANVANLLLVRASARQGEVAVRAALGASRRRLAAQMLVESLVLALAGSALGVLLAVGGVKLLKGLGPDAVPRIDEISVDATVLAFSFAVTIVVALVFGLGPALRLAGTSLMDNLGSEARSGHHPRKGFSRALLLSVEIALSLMLLVAAGLLMRSLVKLYDVELGFDGREVVRFGLSLPSARYDSLSTVASFYQTLEERISALPRVEAVGSTDGAPLTSGKNGYFVLLEGAPEPEPGEELIGWMRPVTPGYFEAMRLRLLRGREIEATDRDGTIPVAVVNETFVREGLGVEDPIGERFRVTGDAGFDSPTWTVVGVVSDERPSLKEEPEPDVYVPHAQYGPRSLIVHVRGRPGAVNLLAAARQQVHALDPNLPLRSPETVREAIRQDAAPTRFFLLLVGLFAGLSVLIAMVGLYGIVSYLVSRRTREIGIRLALGASRMTITRFVLRHALWPALSGIAAGLLASIAVTGVMRSLLFEVEPTDPLVLGAVSALLLIVAAAASVVPARRAMRVNPTEVLRME